MTVEAEQRERKRISELEEENDALRRENEWLHKYVKMARGSIYLGRTEEAYEYLRNAAALDAAGYEW